MKDPENAASNEVVIYPLPGELAELLQQIPACPELTEDKAQERLFPSPGQADDGRLTEDWKSLIEPDLQNQFLADRLTVATDLTRMKEGPKGWKLRIPRAHLEAWISALNQVRLAIAAAHGLGEAEMALKELPADNPPLAQILQRVHFYGLLLEMLVHTVEQGEEESPGADAPAPSDAASEEPLLDAEGFEVSESLPNWEEEGFEPEEEDGDEDSRL